MAGLLGACGGMLRLSVVGMMQIGIDSLQITEAQESLLRLWSQYEWVTARAMTTAAKAARRAVASQVLPMVQGGATPWTKRGLIATYASRGNLSTFVGFQHGGGDTRDMGQAQFKGMGTPAGRYMELGASGGDRRRKSTELRLARAGVLRDGTYMIPFSKNRAIKVDSRGNVAGSTYTRALSRLRGMAAEGSGQDAPAGPGSRGRSGRKRAGSDFFVLRGDAIGPTRWQLGADARAIVLRTGPGPQGGTGKGRGPGRPRTVGYKRGYALAFNLVDQTPNYEARFPIRQVVMRAYVPAFEKALELGIAEEWERRN